MKKLVPYYPSDYFDCKKTDKVPWYSFGQKYSKDGDYYLKISKKMVFFDPTSGESYKLKKDTDFILSKDRDFDIPYIKYKARKYSPVFCTSYIFYIDGDELVKVENTKFLNYCKKYNYDLKKQNKNFPSCIELENMKQCKPITKYFLNSLEDN